MGLICTTTTTWVTQSVLDPVSSWVSQRKKKCKDKKKWWQKLFCWFVTILVEVITWVARNILVPIMNTTCIVVTGIIGGILLPFGAAIDATNDSTHAYNWINTWFITPGRIKFISKEESKTKPDYFDYVFSCKCKDSTSNITVLARNDSEARKLAVEKCKAKCK